MAAVNVFVFGELFCLFTCRSLTDLGFTLGVFSNQWLLLFTYVPAMQRGFGTEHLGGTEWMPVIAMGAVSSGH